MTFQIEGTTNNFWMGLKIKEAIINQDRITYTSGLGIFIEMDMPNDNITDLGKILHKRSSGFEVGLLKRLGILMYSS